VYLMTVTEADLTELKKVIHKGGCKGRKGKTGGVYSPSLRRGMPKSHGFSGGGGQAQFRREAKPGRVFSGEDGRGGG